MDFFHNLVRTTNFGLFGFFGYREQKKGWKIMSSVIIEKKRLLVEGQINPLATHTTNCKLRTLISIYSATIPSFILFFFFWLTYLREYRKQLVFHFCFVP